MKYNKILCIFLAVVILEIYLCGCVKNEILNSEIPQSSSQSNEKEPDSFELSFKNALLCVGEKLEITANVPHGVSLKEVTYKSEDESVAVLNGNVLTAVSFGKTQVRAQLNNGVSAFCNITVIDEPTFLELSRSEIVLFENETYELCYYTDSISTKSHKLNISEGIKADTGFLQTAQDGKIMRKISISAENKGNYELSVNTYNGMSRKCNIRVVERKSSAQIEGFEAIWQLPELPTGCEVTAATMTLRYLGFNIGKCELADLYLPYTFNFLGDVRYKFLGHPRDDQSAGCYSPCIAITVNNYFEAKGLSNEWTALLIDGASPDELYDYVAKGIPVIVWITSSFQEPYVNYYCVGDDGTLIPWMFPEHCAVLVGFDKERGTVSVADSEYAMEYSKPIDEFEKIYDMMMKQAVVIYKK